MDAEDGEEFFRINLGLAKALTAEVSEPLVQMSIGFNPNDFSIAHHSVAKLHSHVRAVPHDIDLSRRQSYSWHEMRRFDRLAFIEPFAPLYHDFIVAASMQGFAQNLLADSPRKNLGYTSMRLSGKNDTTGLFTEVQHLYTAMSQEYDEVASIFTDGQRDPATDRFIPRPQGERLAQLDKFLAARTIYSDESVKVLSYMAENIQPARSRNAEDPFDMSSTAMIYITRGFAGAMTFNFERDSKEIGFDFFPRVISTTPVGKTMLSGVLPSVVDKTSEAAGGYESGVTKAYLAKVVGILHREFPDLYSAL